MTTEKDIILDLGKYWILDTKDSYAVMKTNITHSESDSFYARNVGGLSIAIARCKFLSGIKLNINSCKEYLELAKTLHNKG